MGIEYTAGGVATADLAADAVTSPKIAPNTVVTDDIATDVTQVAVVELDAADFFAMYETPVEVVPAVSGKVIVVDSVDFIMARTSTAFTAGGSVKVQYGNTWNHGIGDSVLASSISTAIITGAAGTTYTIIMPTNQSDKADSGDWSVKSVGLYITNSGAAFADGTGAAVLIVRYHLITPS